MSVPAEPYPPMKLSKLVYNFTKTLFYLFLALAISLPFIGAFLSYDYFDGRAGLWGIDISTFLGFTFDLNQMGDITQNTEGLRDSIIKGKTELQIETVSVKAWYIFIAINEAILLIALCALKQMRDLFASLATGIYFTVENAKKLSNIGIIVIAGHIIIPLLQYAGSSAILKNIKIDIPGIDLFPTFSFDGGGIFAGVLIIILAEIAREASKIYQDQLRTI